MKLNPKNFDVNIQKLAYLNVVNQTNEEIRVGTFWIGKTAVLIFIRHFGCPSCRAHVDQVWKQKDKIESNGGQIIFIGNGASNYISGFKEDLKIDYEHFYTDPKLLTFRACGLKRKMTATLSPKSMMNGMKLMTKGYFPSKQSGDGDFWQLGGIVIVKKDSTVTYQYISEALGDFPEEEEEIS